MPLMDLVKNVCFEVIGARTRILLDVLSSVSEQLSLYCVDFPLRRRLYHLFEVVCRLLIRSHVWPVLALFGFPPSVRLFMHSDLLRGRQFGINVLKEVFRPLSSQKLRIRGHRNSLPL